MPARGERPEQVIDGRQRTPDPPRELLGPHRPGRIGHGIENRERTVDGLGVLLVMGRGYGRRSLPGNSSVEKTRPTTVSVRSSSSPKVTRSSLT